MLKILEYLIRTPNPGTLSPRTPNPLTPNINTPNPGTLNIWDTSHWPRKNPLKSRVSNPRNDFPRPI